MRTKQTTAEQKVAKLADGIEKTTAASKTAVSLTTTTTTATTTPRPLNDEERKKLAELETTIEKGLAEFVVVGTALATIRDEKLYRGHYSSFEQYVRGEWNLGKSHAYRLIDAATVYVEDLSPKSPDGDAVVLPIHEAQIRPLMQLKESDQRKEVWKQLVEKADGGPITEEDVEAAVGKITGKTKAKTKTKTKAAKKTPAPKSSVNTAIKKVIKMLEDANDVLTQPGKIQALLGKVKKALEDIVEEDAS